MANRWYQILRFRYPRAEYGTPLWENPAAFFSDQYVRNTKFVAEPVSR